MIRRGTGRPTLRSVTLVAAAAFVVLATTTSVVIATMSIRVQRALVEEAEQLSTDEHIANLIVSSSYEQQLAAYRYLSSPSEAARRDFYARGDVAYGRIRRYLFRPMPLQSRRSIETIKEAHERLEVASQRAFDLALAGDAAAERAQITALTADAAALDRVVRAFIAEREQQLSGVRRQGEDRLMAIQRISVILTVLLALFAAGLAVLFRRRVSAPITDLSVAVSALGDGGPRVRVAPQRYREFQELADSFDRMADRTAASRAEVEARNVELSRAIEDLGRAQQELVQREKMSAIGEMLAGLAHELNNPLAGIMGIAEVLRGDAADAAGGVVPDLDGSLVDQLISETRRAHALVRNLLNFSRDERPELVPVDLSEAITVAVGLRRHAFTEAQKEIVIAIQPGCAVLAQSQRLELVAINLLNNALDALRGSTGSRLVISARRDGEMVLLQFEDDGPGFADASRVFDPFYTTKPVGEGTGLGLSLVHRFVMAFGGSVTAGTSAAGGACVSIRLRAAVLAPAIQDAAAPAPGHVIAPPETRKRALVVDDERALRFVETAFLKRIGMDVDVAENGVAACEALQHADYDVVITDLRMPGRMSGIELLEWIRRERPELAERVIVVTGDVMTDREGGTLLPPPERIILKPFTSETFLQCVEALLELQPGVPGAEKLPAKPGAE